MGLEQPSAGFFAHAAACVEPYSTFHVTQCHTASSKLATAQFSRLDVAALRAFLDTASPIIASQYFAALPIFGHVCVLRYRRKHILHDFLLSRPRLWIFLIGSLLDL